MTEIPSDFKSLLPEVQRDDRPFVYLWVYDPDTSKVHVHPQTGDHPADFLTHEKMAEDHTVSHPERIDGFAMAIKNGWRIFTDEFKEPDPFIKERVRLALEGKHPPAPLPHIRYHGDPL